MSKRLTYEEVVLEAYRETGEVFLDTLCSTDREIIRRYFGLFPYQSHSFNKLAKVLNLSTAKVYREYRRIIRDLKKTAMEDFKKK